LTFFPQHFLGLSGIPRRYADYSDVYIIWHLVSSYGAYMSTVGVAIFLWVLIEALISIRCVITIGGGNYYSKRGDNQILPGDFHNYSSRCAGLVNI
jgi:heme/copper-type cytochrome/quinol oxidase subunit 1